MNKTSECRLSFSLRIKRAYTEGLFFSPQKSGIHFTEVLAWTLRSREHLYSPGLICSKANEFKKWRWLRSPQEMPRNGWKGQENCTWPVWYFSHPWWAGSLPAQKEQVDRKWPSWLYCSENMEFPLSGVNRTWPNSTFSVLGLLTVSWQAMDLHSNWLRGTRKVSLVEKGKALDSGDAVRKELNVLLLT